MRITITPKLRVLVNAMGDDGLLDEYAASITDYGLLLVGVSSKLPISDTLSEAETTMLRFILIGATAPVVAGSAGEVFVRFYDDCPGGCELHSIESLRGLDPAWHPEVRFLSNPAEAEEICPLAELIGLYDRQKDYEN